MIEKEKSDIVSVATADGLHAEVVIFAMEHGKSSNPVRLASWEALHHGYNPRFTLSEHTVDSSLYLAGNVEAKWVSGVLGAAKVFDQIEKRRITELPVYDLPSQCWSGDPGCLTYTARLTNRVFISHLPAITDMR
jgi:hypothetical protein